MTNNSTKMNETNNPPNITIYGVGNPGTGLAQTEILGEVKPVKY